MHESSLVCFFMPHSVYTVLCVRFVPENVFDLKMHKNAFDGRVLSGLIGKLKTLLQTS